MVFAKLDSVRSTVGPNSTFTQALESKIGQDIIEVLRESSRQGGRPPSKISPAHRKYLTEFATQIKNLTEMTTYVTNWFTTARAALLQLTTNSVELDLRWNYQFTVRYCRIFVLLAKIIVFFFHFTTARWGYLSAALLEDRRLLQPGRNAICDFLTTAEEHPFLLLATRNNAIAAHLGQLISQAGPVLMQVIGQWPLVDWQNFVPFGRTSVNSPDSTLPDLNHICLQNIPILTDVVLFFTITYPDFVANHPQMRAVMKAIFSESGVFFVTRTAGVPISVLLKAYERGTLNQVRLDQAQVTHEREVKSSMSHDQRIQYLLIILRDIVNLCDYDATYLPTLTHDILALSALAFYELNLRFEEAKVSASSMALLDQLLLLTRLYLKRADEVSRFFVFNIGAGDCIYLSKLTRQLERGQFEWQQQLLRLFGALMSELQMAVDLEEFDSGVRYDFEQWLGTHGRVCQHFNTIKLKHRVAYLHPVLEHLETIRLHILFAQSPVRAFLQYCPIHRLWSAGDVLVSQMKKSTSDLHLLAPVFELFAIFNLDYIATSILDGHVKRLTVALQTGRTELLNGLCRMLTGILQEQSPLVQAVKQSGLDGTFRPEAFTTITDGFTFSFFEENSAFMSRVWQLKQMLSRLPEQVEYNGQIHQIAGWIASNAISSMTGGIRFTSKSPNLTADRNETS
jgi:hypothetical protein